MSATDKLFSPRCAHVASRFFHFEIRVSLGIRSRIVSAGLERNSTERNSTEGVREWRNVATARHRDGESHSGKGRGRKVGGGVQH